LPPQFNATSRSKSGLQRLLKLGRKWEQLLKKFVVETMTKMHNMQLHEDANDPHARFFYAHAILFNDFLSPF
jgi:hypothetical protein